MSLHCIQDSSRDEQRCSVCPIKIHFCQMTTECQRRLTNIISFMDDLCFKRDERKETSTFLSRSEFLFNKDIKAPSLLLNDVWACSDNVDVTLVSPRNYFLYTPLLPAAATGTVEERSIVEPVRKMLGNKVWILPLELEEHKILILNQMTGFGNPLHLFPAVCIKLTPVKANICFTRI